MSDDNGNSNNDRRERQMDFILEQQAQLTATVQRLAESQQNHEERIARFERSYVAISELLVSHDSQLVAITDGINDLTSVVNRYITARGNGSNGTNGQG